MRRVVTSSSATGSTSSHRVHTNLWIQVTSIDYDVQVSELHVSGKVAEENAFTKLGQYHTIDLELNHNFTVQKEEWDSVALDTIQESVRQTQQAAAIAVVMQEGLANVVEITEYVTKVKQRVELSISRKRHGSKTGELDSVSILFYDWCIFTTLYDHILTYDFHSRHSTASLPQRSTL
jgi:protein pelota